MPNGERHNIAIHQHHNIPLKLPAEGIPIQKIAIVVLPRVENTRRME
jgi:hypothetical protein